MDKYEDIAKDVCRTTWSKLMLEKKKYDLAGKSIPEDLKAEIEGWIGVSCVIAFMKKNIKPTNNDMAQFFSASPELIDVPLKRLIINGVFNPKRDIKNDAALKGQWDSTSPKTAWCIVAGIASGLCGLR